jgi:dTDP-4-dehydrorhamnose 3,5-epimerase
MRRDRALICFIHSFKGGFKMAPKMGPIDGVKNIPLTRHADDRGYVTEILRADSPHLIKFGQVYVSSCRKGIAKAWHAHEKQTDSFYVVRGTTKIGIYDDRQGSKTKGNYMVVILGEDGEDILLQIPPHVWHGQMALSEMSYMINIPSEPFNIDNPDEMRKGINELEDIWTIKSR